MTDIDFRWIESPVDVFHNTVGFHERALHPTIVAYKALPVVDWPSPVFHTTVSWIEV